MNDMCPQQTYLDCLNQQYQFMLEDKLFMLIAVLSKDTLNADTAHQLTSEFNARALEGHKLISLLHCIPLLVLQRVLQGYKLITPSVNTFSNNSGLIQKQSPQTQVSNYKIRYQNIYKLITPSVNTFSNNSGLIQKQSPQTQVSNYKIRYQNIYLIQWIKILYHQRHLH